MPYITREDGEHFVIPSYRDVLAAKNKTTLKKDILTLSQSYGEYITLQRKNPTQYEVAFSTETGYLLGESIWHHFKRPLDMIYCEAIPNTTEAILVIVKAGSVYLDGSFPLENIPEELIIFLTQQNNFEIYIYGDVPISETPQENKFSFEASSIKSFTSLEKPVFSTLPLLKIYQLQLVEQVLKAHGIGVFPVKQVLTGVVVVGLLWMVWSYLTMEREEMPPVVQEVSPLQAYTDALMSPAPDQEMKTLLDNLNRLFAIPGWMPVEIKYASGNLSALMRSQGVKTEDLLKWAKNNGATFNIRPTGVFLYIDTHLPRRPPPRNIYSLKEVLSRLIDKLAEVYPGNNLQLSEFENRGAYTGVTLTITFSNTAPMVLALIGEQFKDLPFVVKKYYA